MSDRGPIVELAAAVIRCAWQDVKHGGAQAPSARRFLLGEACEPWAAIVGLDVDALRDRVRALPTARRTRRPRTAA
jgi:chemotaxis signal transduction protein